MCFQVNELFQSKKSTFNFSTQIIITNIYITQVFLNMNILKFCSNNYTCRFLLLPDELDDFLLLPLLLFPLDVYTVLCIVDVPTLSQTHVFFALLYTDCAYIVCEEVDSE